MYCKFLKLDYICKHEILQLIFVELSSYYISTFFIIELFLKDVKGLIPKIKNLHGSYEIPGWEHLDFIWAMDAPSKAYNTIIKIMSQNP